MKFINNSELLIHEATLKSQTQVWHLPKCEPKATLKQVDTIYG